MTEQSFRRHARHLLLAWVALLALMFASLGSAYLPLGTGNAVAGLAIAAVKSAIVLALFMGLARASTVLRLVAATALAIAAILFALSGVDYATRAPEPAAYEPPQQLGPAQKTNGR